MSYHKPFQNLLVIDFTHVLAGPACSYYLGLLGARVIKIESVGKGDAIRHRGGTDQARAEKGMSTSFITQGAGKQSVSLDLETDEGQERIHQLLARADIFVENHMPKTMNRLGLDETQVMARHPHLIYCAMSGYGRGGDQENTAAYDVNIQAACGLMEATGTAQSGPIRTGAPVMDYATAMAAGFAISAALYERQKTAKGCFIDVSMLETGLALMSSSITDYLATGNAPQRRGNLANSRSPGAGSFPCREGVISLGVNEEAHFVRLAKALGCDEWLRDERFAKADARKAHATLLADLIEAQLQTQTAAQWEAILQSHDVPCARLRSLPEALSSQQVIERGFVQALPDGTQVPTLPFRLDEMRPYKPHSDVAALGAHNDEVFAWLDGEDKSAE